MDGIAVQKIHDLAIEASKSNRLGTFEPAVLVGNQLVSLEKLQVGRCRFRGEFKTSVLADFADYVKAQGAGQGFIETKAMAAKVFFNLGGVDDPGHGDWTATLTLQKTAAFTVLGRLAGTTFSQKDMVALIEDWSHCMMAKYNTTNNQDIALALTAIRNVTIAKKSEASHTDHDFQTTRTALEDIEARAFGGIPSHLVFRCEPYAGFTERAIQLRLSVLAGEKPEFRLRVVAEETLTEAIAQEFKTRLADAVGDSVELLIGSFTP